MAKCLGRGNTQRPCTSWSLAQGTLRDTLVSTPCKTSRHPYSSQVPKRIGVIKPPLYPLWVKGLCSSFFHPIDTILLAISSKVEDWLGVLGVGLSGPLE